MPARQTSFDLAEQNVQKSLATNRTTDFYILDAYMKAQDRGIDYDINKKIYENIPSLKLKDLVDFAQNRIANKPYKYIILGDEKSLDMKSLEKIAPIKRLTSEDIFGY
jgi:predicted Zn-dependent peptidase